MAIEKHQEATRVVRDGRPKDERFFAALGQTPVAVGAICVLGLFTLLQPWTLHLTVPIAAIWWMATTTDEGRKTLPLYLPQTVRKVDMHDKKEGSQRGFHRARGMFFLGHAVRGMAEVWEHSSMARQHKLMFGTTGAGKTEALTGLFVNFLAVGAGVIFSDAKGTVKQTSIFYRISRRFARDDDFYNINYTNSGRTIYGGNRERRSNSTNPVRTCSADQGVQMFTSFLPKSSGENQIFQDRAVAMITSYMPAAIERRDKHNFPLGIKSIREELMSFEKLCHLAWDKDRLLSDPVREDLKGYLESLSGFNLTDYITKGKDYKIPAEASRMFSYAQNYFTRALGSLAMVYGHIYFTQAGEVDYEDIVLNRRICVITLPALEKSLQELQNLAKMNLSNIKGAIAVGLGSLVEGHRCKTIDNLPSTSEVPTGIIIDEVGYQAAEGLGITLAQARGLGFAITVAGQDLANLLMLGKDEAESVFGNAVLYTLNVRNVTELGARVEKSVGEAEYYSSSGVERRGEGPASTFVDRNELTLRQKYRVSTNDLMSLNTGEGFLCVGKNIGVIRIFPWTPLGEPADEYQINRFLPIVIETDDLDPVIRGAMAVESIVKVRLEGTSRPTTDKSLSPEILKLIEVSRADPANAFRSISDLIEIQLSNDDRHDSKLGRATAANPLMTQPEVKIQVMPGSGNEAWRNPVAQRNPVKPTKPAQAGVGPAPMGSVNRDLMSAGIDADAYMDTAVGEDPGSRGRGLGDLLPYSQDDQRYTEEDATAESDATRAQLQREVGLPPVSERISGRDMEALDGYHDGEEPPPPDIEHLKHEGSSFIDESADASAERVVDVPSPAASRSRALLKDLADSSVYRPPATQLPSDPKSANILGAIGNIAQAARAGRGASGNPREQPESHDG